MSQQVKSLEQALGIMLFRRLPRSLVLTQQGEAYLPAIVSAFNIISKATELTAPALQGRKLRLGVAPQVMKKASAAVRKLGQPASGKDMVTLKVTGDVAELLDGKLDVMLRLSGGSHPGLHIDRFVLAACRRDGHTGRAVDASGPRRMPRTSQARQATWGRHLIVIGRGRCDLRASTPFAARSRGRSGTRLRINSCRQYARCAC